MLWALGGLGTRACAVQCTTTHRAARRGPTHDVLFFLVATTTTPSVKGIPSQEVQGYFRFEALFYKKVALIQPLIMNGISDSTM